MIVSLEYEDLRCAHSKVLSQQITGNLEAFYKLSSDRLGVMRTKHFQSAASLILFLLFCPLASGQTGRDDRTLNYGFASPNVKEGMKLHEAIEALDSPSEWNLLRSARNLRCVVKTEIQVFRSLGSWSDGAENSAVLQLNTDEATMRYLMARIGREADQKAVLYFHAQPTGLAKLYILRPANNIRCFRAIIRLLDRVGIVFRTIVPRSRTMFVYVVETENNLRAKVITAAKQLKARLTTITGNAEFIGSDSERDNARSIFAKEIREYETKHPALPAACGGN